MNCNQAIEYIHSLQRFGIKPGLERIGELCALLGDPQKEVKFIHVAGTNGKGSTSTMIANMLHKSGLKVGLYTSPYVIDFRERIKVDGHMISPLELAQTVEKVKAAVDTLNEKGVEPTEFEVITAAAFLFFRDAGVDVAVLEVGLGGRFDATNIIEDPAVCVLTSISMDHMAVLGNTVAEIAAEKCGIIKQGSVVVAYPEQYPEAWEVIKHTCEEKEALLLCPNAENVQMLSSDAFGSRFSYSGIEISLPLTGAHMVKNAITAVEAMNAAALRGFNVSTEAVVQGIAASAMPARLEVLRKHPLTILDGGHNEGCAQALADYIGTYLKGRRIVALCSMMADKDYDAFLKTAAPLFDVFIASKTNVPRTLGADELCEAAKAYCPVSYSVSDSVHALSFAKSITEEDDVLLICGSFYFASEIRDKL